MEITQAVILAAGKSSRFWPLNESHKSTFKLHGKPLVVHTIEGLKGVKEVIIVQGKDRSVEKALKGFSFPGKKIIFVVQKEPLGTGDALLGAASFIKGSFILTGAHKIDVKEHFLQMFKKFKEEKIVFSCSKTEKPREFGILEIQEGRPVKVIEKPAQFSSPALKINEVYLLPKSFLNYLKRVGTGEKSLIKAFNEFLREKEADFVLHEGSNTSLKYPWDLFNLNKYLFSLLRGKSKRKATIERGCHFKGPFFVGENTIIKSGTYLEGPVYIGKNSQIGPFCYLRPFTAIGDNCHIGFGVEIKNSIISDGVKINHLSYIGDSILGENCNIGAGTIFANLRFDRQRIKSFVKGKMIDTGREKFGSVLGRNVQVGVNTSLMPGTLIGPGKIINPHSLIRGKIKK